MVDQMSSALRSISCNREITFTNEQRSPNLGAARMTIRICHGNLFESKAGAIILTVDGARAGMEGNITRQFGRLYPDAWEDLERDILYPIRLGGAKIYPINRDVDCPFSHCIIASTLHHLELMTLQEKLLVVRSALSSSMRLAANSGIRSLCTPILSGGWRLTIEEALDEMLATCRASQPATVQLLVYIRDAQDFQRIKVHLEQTRDSIIGNNGIIELE